MKKLGFGLMRLPTLDPKDHGSVDYELVCKMVDLFLARGFNYFDTARPYHAGMSEVAVGKCLASRHPRESFFLTDKLTMGMIQKKEDMQAFFDQQLKDCQVEYFDNYLVHNMGEGSYKKATEFGAFEFVEQMKAQGKVREMGFSCHGTPELVERILKDHPNVDYVQLQVNYMDWDSAGIQSRKCCEVARKYGKKILVMEPVKGGTLANLPEEAENLMKACRPDMSVASWAIRFAAGQEGIHMVLSGMTDLAQMEDNLSYMENFQPLNEQEQAVIDKCVDIFNSMAAIPCTACRYCVKGCPMQIDIPKCFSMYNADKQYKENYFSPQKLLYKNTFGEGGAATCIGCGQCQEACPQHLPVIELLKTVAEHFK